MTIQYFAEDQNLVFVPALVALLAATLLICLPIVFVQGLDRAGRRVPVSAVAWTLGAVAIGLAVWQASIGFATLGAERAQVRSDLRTEYGLDLSAAQVGELIDGGKPKQADPEVAAKVGLRSTTARHSLALVPVRPSAGTYELTFGGRPFPS